MAKILVIDDEKSIRNTLQEILGYEGHQVTTAADGIEGLAALKNDRPDLIFCDIKMPRMDGIDVLERAKDMAPDIPFIIISAHGTIDTAVDALHRGAYDFIEKPLDLNRLLITIKNATERHQLVQQTKSLKKQLSQMTPKYQIIGQSPAIERVRQLIAKVAPSDAKVLITGPNGSGKELVARELPELSPRSRAPFVEVNCAAIPSELIESELFGHEKGAFTSAIRQKKGKFELADGGTLFLDEIGDMSLGAQAKVLRALQEQTITRVGGETEIPVNARVIAATNKNLRDEIARGNFREDLYHRLSVIVIDVPPLNQRDGDIPILADYFLAQICNNMKIAKKTITPDAIRLLEQHRYTGNIRELRNVIERLVILGGPVITSADVKNYI